MPETIHIGGLELRFLHTRQQTTDSLDLFEMTAHPNARMPVPHFHESWDETIYALAGTITFRLAATDHALTPGQSLFIPRGTVHGFRNDTQSPATCLCILTPGALGTGYFRAIAALMQNGPPDLTRMRDIMRQYGLIPVPDPI